MEADIRKLWDDFANILLIDLKKTAISREIKEAIRLAEECKPNCGNCDFWMKKRECKLEKIGKKPHVNHPPCEQYNPSHRILPIRILSQNHLENAKRLYI